jgi:putative NADH-flavin reductase
MIHERHACLYRSWEGVVISVATTGNGKAEPKRLTIFGATGNTGGRILELALAQGHEMTVLVRGRAKQPSQPAKNVVVVEGSVLDAAAVDKAIPAGTDAVLSALGHTKGSPRDFETVALGNIISSMRKKGVKRLVVLSNTVVGDPHDDPTTTQRFYLWLVKMFRRNIYDDSLTKGRVVKNSDLDWTVVRTSMLTNSAPKGKYRVGALGKDGGARISRGDMAAFMLRCATDGSYVRESPYISE